MKNRLKVQMLRKCAFTSLSLVATSILVVLGVVLLTGSSSHAAEGIYTNYIPGLYGNFAVAVTPDPGFYPIQDFYYYTADESRAVQSGQLRADVDIDMAMYMVTGVKVFDYEILGGRYAAGAGIPLIRTDFSATASVGVGSRSIDKDRTAIGDLTLIPVSLFWNSGNMYLNFYEAIVAPTGSYDKDRSVDSGLNYWSFDSNLAATYLNMETGREISAVAGYIYNTENDDTDYQTGQEIHLDYMLNQFLSDTAAVGIHGYYYKQITGDSGSGALLGSFKGEAAGVGPAVMWMPKIKDRDITISAKWMHDYHAENRLEGDHLYLNLIMQF
jgi:hypothetical protein